MRDGLGRDHAALLAGAAGPADEAGRRARREPLRDHGRGSGHRVDEVRRASGREGLLEGGEATRHQAQRLPHRVLPAEDALAVGPLDGEPDPLEEYHPNVYGRVDPFNPCLPAIKSRTVWEAERIS